MRDQAERLRQIVQSIKDKRLPENANVPRIVTITSGKGGVGKTNFTINFAISLSELGKRVVIIDADFGLSNVDVMLGIVPKFDLSCVIRQEKAIEDVISNGPEGIKFISGGAGLSELVHMDPQRLEYFINTIEVIEDIADIILIDTGAGISDKVLKMVLAANETILLTTPEPTSITDAYVLAKMALAVNSGIRLKLLINKAESHEEAQMTFDKFSRVAKNFLKTEIESIGYIQYDSSITKAIKEQMPFVLGYPKSAASRQIRGIAKNYVKADEDKINIRRGLRGYIQILAGIWNIKREYVSKGY